MKKEIESQYADDGSEVRRRYEKDVAPLIGLRPPYTVVESDIVKVLDVVAARGANRVAGHMLADLRQMFKFALRRKIVTFNPTDELSTKEWKGESVERDRVLSEPEILLLRDQIPKAKLIRRDRMRHLDIARHRVSRRRAIAVALGLDRR